VLNVAYLFNWAKFSAELVYVVKERVPLFLFQACSFLILERSNTYM
jgi:hypothetical protein